MPGSVQSSAASVPDPDPGKSKTKRIRWWDTWQALVGFIAVVLGIRFLVYEPFKIPSGSMEPTLIGHEDYGDRIITDKLAYSLGKDPKRFDIVVFDYQNSWDGKGEKGSKHYIKRLVGLPGDSLVISGGDLFLRNKNTEVESIIRKWETDPALQEQFWYPVSMATFRERTAEKDATANDRRVIEQINQRALPWSIEAPPGASITREQAALQVQGEAVLTYRYPVWNTYSKVGRWPFIHLVCPANNLPPRIGGGGIPFRNDKETEKFSMPYLPNSWSGVRCPRCGQIRYPLVREDPGDGNEPRIIPDTHWQINQPEKLAGKTQKSSEDENSSVTIQDPEQPARGNDGEATASRGTPFFYGGKNIVGDLKLELGLEVLEAGGALELVVGSDLHRAAWQISLGASAPAAASEEKGLHAVTEQVKLEAGTKHLLSLAYVDGTVVATLDGKLLERKPLENLEPIGKARMKSIAQVRFFPGSKVRLTQLNLFRDLFYTLDLDTPQELTSPNWKPTDRLGRAEEGKLVYDIRPDHFMVLGDNSPSSKDSRVWGYVPREFLIGRASLIWWPPSRCRMMR